MESIVLHRDDCGINDSWFVEHVAVEHDSEANVHFPLSRWLPPYKAMQFNKFDSQLPQMVKKNSPELYKQREAELEQKKKDFAYQPIGNIKGMPRTVKTLPPEEAFSRDYFVSF